MSEMIPMVRALVLLDSYQRRITYLRLSLTDRCNLRCRYCMPRDGLEKLGHLDILSYEEIMRVVSAAAAMGMTKIRLTGGEPLVRRGVVDFIAKLALVPGLDDLRLTTNGVLLADKARDLALAGIKRINISLDSLERETYELMTGRDELDRVWRGVEVALATGFDRIKINCVPIRGLNDREIPAFARMARDLPIEVRFIEFMPLGRAMGWSADQVVSTEEIKRLLELEVGPLVAEPRRSTEGPAQVYRLEGHQGSIGFISPLTDHFCGSCNRLRLTADGKLRLCLLSDREVDLKSRLRAGADQEEIIQILRQAVKSKPVSHLLGAGGPMAARAMNTIGG